MVALLGSLVFVAALVAAVGVIVAMIGAERDRIIDLLDGSAHDIALPHAIAIRGRSVRSPRPRRALPAAARRAAA